MGIQSLLPVAGSIVQTAVNQEFSREMLREKDKLMREQWQRQNEYDNPASQMARLRAAGLNPDLIYSQMSGGTPVQGIESDMMNSSAISSGFAAAGQQDINRNLAESEMMVNDAQAALYAAQADEVASRVPEHESRTRYYDRLVKAQDVTDDLRRSGIAVNAQTIVESQERIKKIFAEVELTEERKEYIKSQKFAQDLENEHFDERFLAEMGLLKAQKNAANASATESIAHAKLLDEQRKEQEEIVKIVAKRCEQEMIILTNKAITSEYEKDAAIGRCYKEIYDTLRYKGLIRSNGDGSWSWSEAGAKWGVFDGVLGYAERLLTAVGHVYSAHGFKNYTPESEPHSYRENYNEEVIDTGKGTIHRTTGSRSRGYF